MPQLDDINISNPDNLRVNTINQNFRRIQNEDNAKVWKDSNGVPFMIMGNGGLKVAQEGIDVNTATDDQLIMSSNFNVPKIVETDTVTITANTTFVSEDIPHNVGSPTIAIVYMDYFGVYSPLPKTTFIPGFFPLDATEHFEFNIDDTRLQINMSFATAPAGTEFTFRYYIFRETAN